MKRILILFFILSAFSYAFAQETTFGTVKSEYDSFQYEKMIKSSDEVLAKGNLPDSLKVEVYIMRAVAFYSLGDDASTKTSFENILKIRRTYNPDPSQISPKLISIFGDVKTDYLKNNPEPVSLPDTLNIERQVRPEIGQAKSFILENLAAPGIGQLQLGNNPKGIILTAASTINLAAMIYFIFDAKNKEKDYLSQTDQVLIQQKYDEYNRSYKIRNTLIISYALIWIYSQVDLLFLNGPEQKNPVQQQIGILQFTPDAFSDYKVGVKIAF